MSTTQYHAALIKKPLLWRLGISMGAIFLLAVFSMISSMFIADTSRGFGAAINHAGTLRMQSYRIASSMIHDSQGSVESSELKTSYLVEEFRERLYSPRIHNVLSKETSLRVRNAYQVVEARWEKEILPRLNAYIGVKSTFIDSPASRSEARRYQQHYLRAVDGFVDNIHHLVKVLELDVEEKNQQMRMIQVVAMILVFVVAIVSMYLAKTSVLVPLRNLLGCAQAARRGDFSKRSSHLSEDELGQLGRAFNVMAADLSKVYSDLEARVQDKTADLERTNRSLELLYSTTRRLNASPLDNKVLQALIQDVEKLLGTCGGSICLGQPGDSQAFRLASTHHLEDNMHDGKPPDCALCLGNGESCRLQIEESGATPVQILSVPIKEQDRQFGVLVLELPPAMQLHEWQERLLETVASHIALAINKGQQASQNRMLALLEERSVIARELHDSIAQSLSYLKIQVARLEKSIREDTDKAFSLQVTDGVRRALNGAYRQLRELLTTFRLRISEAGFNVTLNETVREYSERGRIDIKLVNHIANCEFGANAEIHVIQIVREALANVIRHANATHAEVSMECDLDGKVRIRIEDDGDGIDDDADMMMHYGLPIMKERAEWLNGRLHISEPDTGGTRVELTFSAVPIATMGNLKPHEDE